MMVKETKTDLVAGTLSDEDRAGFLKMMGLTQDTPAEEAEAIRQQWTDENILAAIGSGLY
jgi:hypothetical protein